MVGLWALPLIVLFSLTASADSLAAGYISYDVTVPGSSAEFDIFNGTGANSSGDATFPITTAVSLSSLSLTIDFSDGSSTVEGASYFTLAPDGLSFDGTPIGIGGASPQPTEAILTGVFSPTTVTMFDGTVETITAAFSATVLPSSPPDLGDGDLAVIYATTSTTTSTVPEPGSLVLLGTILAIMFSLGAWRRLGAQDVLRKLPGLMRAAALPVALAMVCCLLIPAARAAATVKQGTVTSPSSGTAGNNVNVTVSTGWPAGDTKPADVTVTWASSCGGAVSATNSANTLTKILPGSERVDVTIPASLATGNYFVQVADSVGGDTDFTASNCSEIQVTGSSRTLEACVPASSLGVVAPLVGPAPVKAYIPNGSWCCSYSTGFEVVQVEAGGGPAVPPVSIVTPDDINSCAGNPATGEAVCVSNGASVYHVSASNAVTALTSGTTGLSGFSGGTCENCGIAINSNTNQAVITEGNLTAPSGSAMQVLNLSNNTFGAAFPMFHEVSENVVVDVPDSLILSADEDNQFEVVGFDAGGNLTTEYSMSFAGSTGEPDSTAVDCSTRMAIAPLEFSYPNAFFLTDLSQAKYTPGAPGSWSAPYSLIQLDPAVDDAAGPCGSAVAPGSNHLAVITGEFGGSEFQILKLPAAGGTGGAAPTLPDYADVACVPGFSAGYDPHTVTAYVSPNDGKSYALFANWDTNPPSLLKADMAGILALPRGANGHTVIGDSGCLDPAGPVGSTVLQSISSSSPE
jgi:hypothetical protein